MRNHHPDSRQPCSEGYEEFLGTEGWQTIGKTDKLAQSDVGLGRELKLCKRTYFHQPGSYPFIIKVQNLECLNAFRCGDAQQPMQDVTEEFGICFDGLAVSQLFL